MYNMKQNLCKLQQQPPITFIHSWNTVSLLYYENKREQRSCCGGFMSSTGRPFLQLTTTKNWHFTLVQMWHFLHHTIPALTITFYMYPVLLWGHFCSLFTLSISGDKLKSLIFSCYNGHKSFTYWYHNDPWTPCKHKHGTWSLEPKLLHRQLILSSFNISAFPHVWSIKSPVLGYKGVSYTICTLV